MFKADDHNPYAFVIKNDTYSTDEHKGLRFYQSNAGNVFVENNGAGGYTNLYINQSNGTTSRSLIVGNTSGAVELSYDNSKKFETKSDGIDVTGEVQCDSLDVDGNVDIEGSLGIGTASPAEALEIYRTNAPGLKLNDGGQYASYFQLRGNDLEIRGSSGILEFYTGNADGASSSLAMQISANQHVSIGTTTANRTFQVGKSGAETFELEPGESANNNLSLHFNRNTSQYITNEVRAIDHRFLSSTSEKVRVNTHGLTFNGDTAAANALDDYEEGTWTPVINKSGVGGTAGTASASLDFIEESADCSGFLFIGIEVQVIFGNNNNQWYVSGLPFNVATLANSAYQFIQ